jgi:hypothetical protein
VDNVLAFFVFLLWVDCASYSFAIHSGMRHTDGPACIDVIEPEAKSFMCCTASSTGSLGDALEVTLEGLLGVKCDARPYWQLFMVIHRSTSGKPIHAL